MANYESTWRNKWLTAEAESIDDMINALQAAADELRRMKAAGIVLGETTNVRDDFAILITTDPKVAEEFGFDEEFLEDEDEQVAMDDLEEKKPFEQKEENR